VADFHFGFLFVLIDHRGRRFEVSQTVGVIVCRAVGRTGFQMPDNGVAFARFSALVPNSCAATSGWPFFQASFMVLAWSLYVEQPAPNNATALTPINKRWIFVIMVSWV
jgi:hypothetical protein